MDGLSAAASVIAVIQITASLASILREYYTGVRDAKADIQRLYYSMNSLRTVVAAVKQLNDRFEKSLTIPALLTDQNGPLQSVLLELKRIETKIGGVPKDRSARVLKSLKWPFKKADVEKMVLAIDSNKSTLALQFTVENLNIGLRNFDLEEHQRIIEWLSISLPDTSKEHNIARDKHEPTTGSWLLESPQLKTWMESKNSLAWLNGGAGVGKSILCSTVINYLQEICKDEPETVVAYWYFTFTDAEKQNVSSMLCSLIRDIFSNRLDIPVELQDAFEMANNGLQRPSTKALTELLKAVVHDFGTVYLVVDAVDECPKFGGERAKLLKLLHEIFSWRLNQLHIFVTGRREVDILDAFDEIPRQFGHLQVINAQGAQWQGDIELFLMQRLQDSRFRSWNLDMRNEVKSKLVSRAQGMFRLVALQLDALARCRTQSAVQAAIESLPKSLDAFYERVFLDIAEEDQPQVIIALQWLAYSARGLSVAELAEAVTLRTDNVPYVDVSQRLLDGKMVVEMLTAGLITIWSTSETINHSPSPRNRRSRYLGDEDHDWVTTSNDLHSTPRKENDLAKITIRLAHFSIQEWLLSPRIVSSQAAQYQINELSANNLIAEMCFAYLIHLGDLYSDGSHIPKDVFRQFPLLHYVATFWASHLHRLEKKPRSTRLDDLSLRFFSSSAPPWQFWLNFMGFSYRGDGRLLQKLHYLQVVDLLSMFPFEWPTSYSSPSNNGFTSTVDPLSWMTVFPLDDQIQLCLDNGLSNRVSSPERYLGTPMYAAAVFGHLSTTNIFLQKGMKVEDSKGPHGTALHVASHNGNQSMVQLFVESGADVNVHCNGLKSPLTIAALHKDKSIFYYLLDHGADPNVPCPLGERLLNRFIREKPFNEKIVLRLLASGADIEARGIISTPLQEAINLETESIVRLLLEHGANPNSGGEPYGGPLEAAARSGHWRLTSLLLESGADVNGEGKLENSKKYKSPLEYAVDNVRPAIVRLLLDAGAGRDRSQFDNAYTQARRRHEGFILRTGSEAPSKWLRDKLNGSQAILSAFDKWLAKQNVTNDLKNSPTSSTRVR